MTNVLDLPTNGYKILDDARHFISRFCVFPDEHCLDAVTLWGAHAHMAYHFDTSPRLALLSPEPGSGKTRVLEILETLTPEPMSVFGASTAALFRSISERDITLILDEVDTIFTKKGRDDEHQELRALLNMGYKNGAMIPRCVGPNNQVEFFKVFAPTALAGLGDLPETILSRSIPVRMRKRAPDEYVEPYRPREHAKIGNVIRDRLSEWALKVGPRAGRAWPELPPGVADRLAEVWEPIIAVADVGRGEWPERARKAAQSFTMASREQKPSLGVKLLHDLKQVFGNRQAMFTEDILSALNRMDEAPWGDLRGRPLDARGLASRLKAYSVRPRDVRVGETHKKGYSAADLHDAWRRYLSEPVTDATRVTCPENSRGKCRGSDADRPGNVTDARQDAEADTAPDAGVTDVTDSADTESGRPI